MGNQAHTPAPLTAQLKHFIVDSLGLRDVNADQITDDEPLIDGALGLDSLDALSLAICLEDEFGITIRTKDESRRAFASVASLADFIRAQPRPAGAASQTPAAA